MQYKFLTQDPRYLPFVERYSFDLLRFAVEVVGITPTWQQVELFNSVNEAGSRTSVSSGHGTGKTSSAGIIALWHLLCYYNSNTYLTAPKLKTLQEGTWKEITDSRSKMLTMPHAWICDYFEIESEKVYVKGAKAQWFITARTAPKGSPENLAGTHRDWLLWFADEASGIPDENFGVIGGALTDARNRFWMASQPTRPSGFFYDTHNKLSKANGGDWTALVFDSEQSPLVSDSFLKAKLLEYGGRDEPEYQIKVRGRFPEHSDEFLLGRKMLESRIGAESPIKPDDKWGYILAVDVGAGEYRDKSVATLAKVVGTSDYGEDVRRVEVVDVPIFTNSRNIQDFTGEIVRIASELSNCTVLVDAGGMGVAVCQSLEQHIPNIVRVKWGNPCFKKRYRERFFNQRSQATVLAAKAVKEGRISFPNKYTKELLDQGSRLPYHFDEKARYVVEPKEKMRSDGIPSPDLFDTIAFLFLEDAVYMQSESVATIATKNRVESTRDKAKDALSELDNL